jgi:hypothetical protein
LQEKLQSEPHTRVRYFCSTHQSENALHPIITQLRRAASLERDDTPQARFRKLEVLVDDVREGFVNVDGSAADRLAAFERPNWVDYERSEAWRRLRLPRLKPALCRVPNGDFPRALNISEPSPGERCARGIRRAPWLAHVRRACSYKSGRTAPDRLP